MLTYAVEKKRPPSLRRSGRATPAKAACGPAWRAHQAGIRRILRGPTVQPKLTVGAPNDRYEQEADRVADAVLRMPEPRCDRPAAPFGSSPPMIQRLCTECEDDLQRRPIAGQGGELQTKLQRQSIEGGVLPGSLSDFFGPANMQAPPASKGSDPFQGPDREFASPEGIKVMVRRSCGLRGFGFTPAHQELVGQAALKTINRILNTQCISADRRARISKSLKKFRMDIRCRRSRFIGCNCAVSKPDTPIITLGSRNFPGHPDQDAGDSVCASKSDRPCVQLPDPVNAVATTILHEIVHQRLSVRSETLPDSCEKSCFGTERGQPPEICQTPKSA